MAPVELALSIAAALALAGVMAVVGARCCRLARIPLPPALTLPISFLLGAWLVALAVVLLGLANVLAWWSLVPLLIVLTLAGRWRWRRIWAPVWPATVAGLPLLAVALAPPFFFDALVYHLGLPWQALLERGFHPHPENVFAAFPPLAQAIYTVPLAFGLERVPALLHWTAFMAAGAVLFVLARSLGASRPVAGIAAGAWVLAPTHALVPGFPAAEGWCVAAVASSYALLLQRRPHRSWLLLAGVLLGVASAARLQALPWVAGAMALAMSGRPSRCRSAGALAAGWALGASPWWLKNLVLLGQPFAPIGWRREGLETLWRDGGSVVFALQGVGPLLVHTADALRPLVWWLTGLVLAAVLAVIQQRDRRHRWLLAAVAVGALAWALLSSLPRCFALPALFVAALAAATRRGPGRWASTAAIGLAAVLGLMTTISALSGAGLWSASLSARTRSLIVDDPGAAFAAARSLPADARVLFVGEVRGYGFPRRFIAPSQHDVSPLRDIIEGETNAAAARARLTADGFSHLLVSRRELARLGDRYPVQPWRTAVGRARFAELLRSLGPPAAASGEVAVYALRVCSEARLPASP